MKEERIFHRTHQAIEIITPTTIKMSEIRSFLILQVAIPPQEEALEGDQISIRTGSVTHFRHPLRPAMDMYRPELIPSVESFYEIERRMLEQINNLIKEQGQLAPDQIELLSLLHQQKSVLLADDKRDGPMGIIPSPRYHIAVGILLARTILVPPSKDVTIDCDLGSKVTVYLGGLNSERI